MPASNKRTNPTLEIPEIPAGAKLQPLHRRPRAGAKLPVERIELRLEKHLVAWLRAEARRQKQEVETLINEALRQFIIEQIDATQSPIAGSSSIQRTEVVALVHEVLAGNGARATRMSAH
jgi:uncharacterized protein (DUF4415 family)